MVVVKVLLLMLLLIPVECIAMRLVLESELESVGPTRGLEYQTSVGFLHRNGDGVPES